MQQHAELQITIRQRIHIGTANYVNSPFTPRFQITRIATINQSELCSTLNPIDANLRNPHTELRFVTYCHTIFQYLAAFAFTFSAPIGSIALRTRNFFCGW